MDVVVRQKLIDMVSGGAINHCTSFGDIAKHLGIDRDEASDVWHEYKLERQRERYHASTKRYNSYSLRKNHPMYVNGVKVPGERRSKPVVCELCVGEHCTSDRLYYHHWDNSDLSRGVWVCQPCHQICEHKDGYNGNRKDLQTKYLQLKGNINNCSI